MGYNRLVIKSFAHKGLEQFFLTGNKAGIQPQHATHPSDSGPIAAGESDRRLRIPTLRLHELKGDRKGTWSVTVQANWRITFRFAAGDADDVDYEDYH